MAEDMAEEGSDSPPVGGWWYLSGGEETASSVQLLNELCRYRESAVRMRSRVREDMGMGEKGLLALRLLLGAKVEEREVPRGSLPVN